MFIFVSITHNNKQCIEGYEGSSVRYAGRYFDHNVFSFSVLFCSFHLFTKGIASPQAFHFSFLFFSFAGS